MSRLLKTIVHLIIICTLVCVIGLVVPPFFGVTTVIMDDSDSLTNLPMGSVTYAIPVKTTDMYVGDPILVQEDGKNYRYNLESINLENGTGTVVNPAISSDKKITVAVRDYVPKVVVTIGFIGYLMVATKSLEGMIILGLAVLFLIILYIIAELWKKEPADDSQDEEEEEDDEEEEARAKRPVKTAKELRQEERIKSRQLREEEEELRKAAKEEAKKTRKEERKPEKEAERPERKNPKKREKKMIRTGGFVDEIEDDEPEDPEEKFEQVERQIAASAASAASEAHETLKKEIAAATAAGFSEEVSSMLEEKSISKGGSTGTFDLSDEDLDEKRADTAAEKEIGELAMPRYTAKQLREIIQQDGDAPDMIQDDTTNLTLFDFSDIILDDDFDE